MCIRDSVGDDARHAFGTAVEEGRDDGDAAVGQRPAAGLGAVSYTHLRAHETALDLVCRLLLEKKKLQDYSVFNQTLRRSPPYHTRTGNGVTDRAN